MLRLQVGLVVLGMGFGYEMVLKLIDIGLIDGECGLLNIEVRTRMDELKHHQSPV